MTTETEFARRRMHAYHFEVEKDIYASIIKIERLDTDDDLMSAVINLRKALFDVSNYYDKKIKQMLDEQQ